MVRASADGSVRDDAAHGGRLHLEQARQRLPAGLQSAPRSHASIGAGLDIGWTVKLASAPDTIGSPSQKNSP